MQKFGYNTAWVGKIHLGHELQGFDYYDILVGQGHYFNPDFISKEGRKRGEGYVSDLVTADQWELFDLHQDPKELNNVYTDRSYAKIASKMKKKLLDEIKSFEDEEALEIFNQQID